MKGDRWRNSNIQFRLMIIILDITREKNLLLSEVRINCSLRENDGFYRWLGIQFVVKEKNFIAVYLFLTTEFVS